MTTAIQTFGFQLTVERRAVGKLIADDIAEGIHKRSIETQSSQSEREWPENSDNPAGKRYRARKNMKVGTEPTNTRTGHVLSVGPIRGEVIIEDGKITMRYGTGGCPNEASNGAALTHQDATTTDLEKSLDAHWQTRGFCDLDENLCDMDIATVKMTLGEHLRNQGR